MKIYMKSESSKAANKKASSIKASNRPAPGRPGRYPVSVILILVIASLFIGGCRNGIKSGTQSAGGKDESSGQASDPRVLEAVFFDVGKGDCILFSNSAGHVLVDAGYEETSEKIIKELKKRGITSLNAMIITHYDKDHVGGAAEIAEQIPPSVFYLPDYTGEEEKSGDLLDLIDKEGLNAVRVSSDESFSLGEVRFIVDAALVPYDEEEENDNDASLIVEVFNGEDEWLLPGDIEKEAVEVWLDTREGETFDILKMPHHGRKKKNTGEFIESVSPKIAVITDSSEDEAAPKVLKKLEEEEVKIYRSSTNGTITITSDGKEGYSVSTQK